MFKKLCVTNLLYILKIIIYLMQVSRKNHSIKFAALQLIDLILENMDNGKIPLAIFLDLSKAFDTINHQILLTKLYHYGIYGTQLKLIHSYLSNRKQYFILDDTLFNTLYINTGVPQGSILGPILFIIYVNDICNASKLLKTICYADDSTLYTKIDNDHCHISIHKINNELEKINEWFKLNKLALNVDKSVFMLFQHSRKYIEIYCNTSIINRLQ